MPSDDTEHERPDNWAAQIRRPSRDCDHDYRWDRANGNYVCIYCGDRFEAPPIQHKFSFPVGRKSREVHTETEQ